MPYSKKVLFWITIADVDSKNTQIIELTDLLIHLPYNNTETIIFPLKAFFVCVFCLSKQDFVKMFQF